MAELKLNFVYRYMREERLVVPMPTVGGTAVWSREEESGCDAVIHLSGYSYNRRRARCNPTALRILYLCEPLSVYPLHFMRGFWEPFDAVLTWNDQLAEASPRMRAIPVVSYDFPFATGHGVYKEIDAELPDVAARRKAICQIVGDKYSPINGQLYSKRRAAARWFHAKGRMDMDVYGRPAMNVPNHKGGVESKLATMQRYRYALCFENLHHPIWSRGYVTEKIFDCMYADCIPIYYGCSNIESIVPKDCFIDFRAFRDFAELDRFLFGLSDADYLAYVRNIRTFLREYNAPQRCSVHRLYEAVAGIVRKPPESSDWPDGFWTSASVREKTAYLLMACGLKGYRFVQPFFGLIRRFGR